jgi:hypothetical protein
MAPTIYLRRLPSGSSGMQASTSIQTVAKLLFARHPGPCHDGWPGDCGPWLSPGAIAAIVLGSLVGAALLICLCMMATRRRSRRRSSQWSSTTSRSRSHYATDPAQYTAPSGVRGGGGDVSGMSEYEVSDFGSGMSGVTRVTKAKTRKGRHHKHHHHHHRRMY